MIHDKDDRYYLIAVARSRQEVMNHAHALLYAFEHFVLATSGPRAAEEAPPPARVIGITTIQKQSPTKHASPKHPPSKGKEHRRSSSVSSDSSLSEVPDDEPAREAIGKDEDSLSMTDFVLTIVLLAG
ncbi:hypothetical protein PG987_010793 [Apiospora arundinis]